MSRPALAFDRVTVTFPGAERPSLDGCSFEIGPSERVALLGLNGSGKTTLLLAAVGLVPYAGRIAVDGEELNGRSAARLRRNLGFLFSIPEDQLLLPSVEEDVAFSLVQQGKSRTDAKAGARLVLEELGIAELSRRAPFQLSHGQRLMAALAGILAPRPALLLLDEPTSRLDPPSRIRLAHLLGERAEAVLAATHDLEFASRLCPRYILLDRGRVLETGCDYRAAERHFRFPAGGSTELGDADW